MDIDFKEREDDLYPIKAWMDRFNPFKGFWILLSNKTYTYYYNPTKHWSILPPTKKVEDGTYKSSVIKDIKQPPFWKLKKKEKKENISVSRWKNLGL
jgi:hypothetical protein